MSSIADTEGDAVQECTCSDHSQCLIPVMCRAGSMISIAGTEEETWLRSTFPLTHSVSLVLVCQPGSMISIAETERVQHAVVQFFCPQAKQAEAVKQAVRAAVGLDLVVSVRMCVSSVHQCVLLVSAWLRGLPPA